MLLVLQCNHRSHIMVIYSTILIHLICKVYISCDRRCQHSNIVVVMSATNHLIHSTSLVRLRNIHSTRCVYGILLMSRLVIRIWNLILLHSSSNFLCPIARIWNIIRLAILYHTILIPVRRWSLILTMICISLCILCILLIIILCPCSFVSIIISLRWSTNLIFLQSYLRICYLYILVLSTIRCLVIHLFFRIIKSIPIIKLLRISILLIRSRQLYIRRKSSICCLVTLSSIHHIIIWIEILVSWVLNRVSLLVEVTFRKGWIVSTGCSWMSF